MSRCAADGPGVTSPNVATRTMRRQPRSVGWDAVRTGPAPVPCHELGRGGADEDAGRLGDGGGAAAGR
ncbi:hypothetical protein Mkiyose1665_46660 [Mycobacterium kiyosense]|uniref:Uncharacterized protein n=1 Tax=Mycobacterium kiyosense TaxID=2871094 RepID=A0A9P3QAG5_9MYCO|nr:hypothetical protein IWGMT90018_62060 [Mycobacterium kiyosense]BDE11370.1 hypothetical protein MKCMC460_02300 [Mycobacterium sp. 20KCMC460]GLB86259.1 hypothetical protein SRL2020028_55150 [Mycobacterium kiyosense]GLB92827.1 hypothetical protein SRL2020130_56440 [Mycobacterium kiyosense]GLB98825.1 hypothetical protein SRL2020226_56010 [Mycobacterium kiyosense]